VSEQQRGRNSAGEGREVRDDVIGGRNEPTVEDMGDRDDNTASERDREKEAHHKVRV